MNLRDFQSVQDRRRFLQTACGVGTISLTQLLHMDRLTAAAEDAPSLNPLAPKTAACPGDSTERHFSVDVGRAEPIGFV